MVCSFDCMPGGTARWQQHEGALFQWLLSCVKLCKGAAWACGIRAGIVVGTNKQ